MYFLNYLKIDLLGYRIDQDVKDLQIIDPSFVHLKKNQYGFQYKA
jgi:hypothetical protein